jgi:hypothetical protein
MGSWLKSLVGHTNLAENIFIAKGAIDFDGSFCYGYMNENEKNMMLGSGSFLILFHHKV